MLADLLMFQTDETGETDSTRQASDRFPPTAVTGPQWIERLQHDLSVYDELIGVAA